MAASQASRDYVHVLRDMLVAAGSSGLAFRQEYNAAWEQNYATFDKTAFNSQFTPEPDLVVVALGENVSYASNYDAAFLALIDYVRAQAPRAQIVVRGSFWAGHEQADAAAAAAAAARGLLYVPCSQLDTTVHRTASGALITGDDLALHAITDGGVAAHPNDSGMALIARAVYTKMFATVGVAGGGGGSGSAPVGGVNVGGSTVGIYQSDSSLASSGNTTSKTQTFNFGSIANPPGDSVMNPVRYYDNFFTETVGGFTPGASYHCRVFSAWADADYSFAVLANGAAQGTIAHAAADADAVKMLEFDASADSSGVIVFRFNSLTTFALVNAIDWTAN